MIDVSDQDILELGEYVMELILLKKINEGKMVFSGTVSETLN